MPADISSALLRWEATLAGARHQAEAIPDAADGVLTALITEGRHDSPAFDDALRSLQDKVAELSDELDAGWESLDEVYESAIQEARQAGDPEEARRLRWQRAAQRRKAHEIRSELNKRRHKVDVEARADAARALHAQALREWEHRRSCSGCDAPLEVGAVHTAVDLRCDACGELTRVVPGPATTAYLADDRVGALGEEAGLEQWVAWQDTQLRYRKLHHPLQQDFEELSEQSREYWRRWAEVVEPLHPGWDGQRAREEADRRAEESIAPWATAAEQQRREQLTQAAGMVREGQHRELLQSLNKEHSTSESADLLDALCVSLHEHEDRGAAWQCLALVHHLRQPGEDRDSWMRRRIAELDEELRTR